MKKTVAWLALPALLLAILFGLRPASALAVYSPDGSEVCWGGADEDGDSLVDCDDPDCSGDQRCTHVETDCGNGVDDDEDANVDCNDSDCAGSSACDGSGGSGGSCAAAENCSTQGDEDCNGLADASDAACAGVCRTSSWQFWLPPCPEPEQCGDGVDNDLDGSIDCADADCASDGACSGGHECGDGTCDSDESEATCPQDCTPVDPCAGGPTCDPSCPATYAGFCACNPSDPSCVSGPTCGDGTCDAGEDSSSCAIDCAGGNVETDCHDGVDNDHDGLTDCYDSDCAADPGCQPQPEVCDNGKDDDFNGATDCLDLLACANFPACQPQPEICDDYEDNDQDHLLDCADPDCFGQPPCVDPDETEVGHCEDGYDNDGDGSIDLDDTDCLISSGTCEDVEAILSQTVEGANYVNARLAVHVSQMAAHPTADMAAAIERDYADLGDICLRWHVEDLRHAELEAMCDEDPYPADWYDVPCT